MPGQIRITLNGEPREVPAALSVAALLAHLGLAGRRLAVERNGRIVPRSVHEAEQVEDGDALELVQAIGGG